MWKEIRPALRNAFVTLLIIGLGTLIYNVLILRGRPVEWDYFDQHKWNFRSLLASPEQERKLVHFSTNEYHISLLADGQYERRIKNNSLMPFLVTMYAFKDWKYQLPAPMLLWYAERYSVNSLTHSGGIDSGFGFDCGTGLGQTLIRPFEKFIDTISRGDLLRQLSVQDFVKENNDGLLVDEFTREVYGLATEFDMGNQDKLLALMPNDSLSIRFYLPVTAWTNLAQSKF